MQTVLCLSRDPSFAPAVEPLLRRAGYRTAFVSDWPEAAEHPEAPHAGCILLDANAADAPPIPLGKGGFNPPLPVLVMDRASSVDAAVAWLQAGAVDYLPLPSPDARLMGALRRALTPSRGDTAPSSSKELVGRSPALRRVLGTLAQAAPLRTTILLQGESGTGKEVLARTIHQMSPRAQGPFVALNCAALPEGLAESVLFGHERGAFTGATHRVAGAFERAHGGTLLLDEISEMDLRLQAKLLRAIQEMQIERVGGAETLEVDVRIVATTNRDLAQAVDQGLFREDLYYRLSVVPVQVPTLRERAEDIPDLARYFVARFSAEFQKPVHSLSAGALSLLMEHEWPGNVRELSHAIERAVALAEGPVLEAEHLRLDSRGIVPWRGRAGGNDTLTEVGNGDMEAPVAVLYSYRIDEAERVLIERALEASGGNRTRAAELLGITSRTLRNKLNG